MTRRRNPGLSAALLATCVVGLVLIVVLAGCAHRTPWPHFTTPAGADWLEACEPACPT